eukprot:comp20278_c0_seq1/m.25427 comp20278_c0_seq1/g.25427  ORF comp20278_c0_seq1/g.25427 comp20278_c0_seq1/m.25427 type:complete len:175 (-) comp20278_c0_seq1:201-725(-)
MITTTPSGTLVAAQPPSSLRTRNVNQSAICSIPSLSLRSPSNAGSLETERNVAVKIIPPTPDGFGAQLNDCVDRFTRRPVRVKETVIVEATVVNRQLLNSRSHESPKDEKNQRKEEIKRRGGRESPVGSPTRNMAVIPESRESLGEVEEEEDVFEDAWDDCKWEAFYAALFGAA